MSIFLGVAFNLVFVHFVPAIIGIDSVAAQISQAIGWLGILFVVPASISAIRQMLRARTRKRIDVISGLYHHTFGDLIEAYYRSQGFRTLRQLEGRSNEAISVRITNDRDEQFLIGFFQWSGWRIGVDDVRKMLDAVTANRAAGGIVLTAGRINPEAHAFARGRPLEFIDGERLVNMLGDRLQEAVNAPCLEDLDPDTCPYCKSAMVVRTQKRPDGDDETVYGCSSSPRCHYARIIG